MKLVKNKTAVINNVQHYKYMVTIPINLIRELELVGGEELDCTRLGDGIYIRRTKHNKHDHCKVGIISTVPRSDDEKEIMLGCD